MAKIDYILPFTKAWEGGLSRATTDTASSNPAPWPYNGQMGWHTNRGITFTTFSSLASKLGYSITPENFFLMPDAIWLKIAKTYWDGLLLDQVKSNAIASALFSWEWGSGDYGAGKSLGLYLKSKGIIANTDQEQVNAINKLILGPGNEEKIFRELIAWRKAFFENLNQPANLQGWLNRLIYGSTYKGVHKPSMLEFGLGLIKKKSS